MFSKTKSFFAQLISDNDTKSSSRFATLVALAVSSWVMIYVTLNYKELIETLFMFYIGTFALQYIGSKSLSVIKGKGIESKGDSDAGAEK